MARTAAVFLVLMLVALSAPALAVVYNYVYSSNTGTVRSPTVTLGAGTAGSTTVSSVAPDAATVTGTAGLTFYETSNAQTATPSLDGSSSVGAPGLIQNTFAACSAATTCSKAFAGSVASGDILVVSAEWQVAVTSPSISDSRCASWTAVPGSPNSATAEAGMWYCTASSSGADAPSVSWTTAVNAKLDIYEIAGYTATGLACNTGSGTGTTFTVTSTSFSGLPFLVAAYAVGNTHAWSVAPGAGFTLSDTSAQGDGGSGEYAISAVISPTTFPASKNTGPSFTNSWAGIGCAFPQSTSPSASVFLTTTGTSDVIYVMVSILNSGSQSVSSVTDSASLTYAQRSGVSFGTNVRIETWYATTTAAQGPDVIKVTISGATQFTVIALGVSGVDTSSPFDPAVATPASATGTGTAPSASITTSFPNDFIVGAVASGGIPTLTAGTGFTSVASASSPLATLEGGAERESVTSAQSAASVGFTLGTVQNWAMVADAVIAGRPSTTANTATTSSGTGSFTLAAGASAFLWSPPYTAGGTLYVGSWLLDMWGSKATSSGTLTMSAYIVTSTNALAAAVLSSQATGSIPTAETEVKTSFSGPQVTIPVNGQIMFVLTNPLGATTATVFWGTGQTTNFQTPSSYNYVLAITNTGATAWNVNLATASSQTSNLGRLTATLSFVSPASNQIVVSGGSLTQSSGPVVSLAASGTIDIQVVATASSMPTSSNTPSTITFVIKVASTSSTAYAQYTIVVNVN